MTFSNKFASRRRKSEIDTLREDVPITVISVDENDRAIDVVDHTLSDPKCPVFTEETYTFDEEVKSKRQKCAKEYMGTGEEYMGTGGGANVKLRATDCKRIIEECYNSRIQGQEFFTYGVKMTLRKTLRKVQRPKYTKDGNRGCIKDENGDPAELVITSPHSHGPFWAILQCSLLSNKGAASSMHFEPYWIEGPREEEGLLEFGMGGITVAAKTLRVYPGETAASLYQLGIKRKEQTTRTNRLEKDCQLVFNLVLLGPDLQILEHAEHNAGEIRCEQPVSPPNITCIEPQAADIRRSKVLMIKGKNFLPNQGDSKPKICFKLEGQSVVQEMDIIEKIATKEVIACHIPSMRSYNIASHVQNFPKVEISVKLDDKESDPYRFFEYLDFDDDEEEGSLPDLTELFDNGDVGLQAFLTSSTFNR